MASEVQAKGTRRRPPKFPRKYSGRLFSQDELHQIRVLIADSPDASRTAISRVVCRLLNWRKVDGALKEVSCRVALLRMQDDGLLQLPPSRGNANCRRGKPTRTSAADRQPPQAFSLAELGPLQLQIVTPGESAFWNERIDRCYYS